jgi:hypothetical protein
MSFNYKINISDPTGSSTVVSSVLAYDLGQALNIWSGYINGLGTLTVNLDFTQTSNGRLAGGPASVYMIGSSNGTNIVEPGAEYELATGQPVPNGSGGEININVDTSSSYLNTLDLSPNLTAQSSTAPNTYNPITLFLHELMHGFAMSGYYSQSGVLTPTGWESNFDSLLQLTPSGKANFTGVNATAVYGGNVPITTGSTAGENYYHFGNTLSDFYQTPATVTDPLTLDLMNGVVFFYNHDYTVSNLDLAVLRDLGYNIPNITLNEGPGNLSVQVGTGHYTVNGGSGVDTVQVSGSASSYQVTQTATGYTVSSTTTPSNTFDLNNVDRLQFSDGSHLALDVGSPANPGHAGIAAEILGGIFGPTSIANAAYAGIGLYYLDGGTSELNLTMLALNARLGTGFTNTQEVDQLYQNIMGAAPTAAQAAPFISLITSGQYTQASFAVMADHWNAENTGNINLVGLAHSGLSFTPV